MQSFYTASMLEKFLLIGAFMAVTETVSFPYLGGSPGLVAQACPGTSVVLMWSSPARGIVKTLA